MSDKHTFLDEALDIRKENHRLRSLMPVTPHRNKHAVVSKGKSYINFSSNNYLGLAKHPQVIRRSQKYLQKYGAGAKASRLVTGTLDIHVQLEQQIATAFNKQAALIFNSGFQANSSILGTVTDRHSLILADKLSHSSILQGALSGRADFQRFDHNNLNHLETLLQKAKKKNYNRIWIVTETVFSMDGDRSPVSEIAQLAEEYQALFFVDDAHAVGVWGKDGLGLANEIGGIDILLGTCGKAFGSFGAYVACSKEMKDYLINFCPGFIYTTALPPAVIGATEAALELIPTLRQEREAYHERIEYFRQSVQDLGFEIGPSSTQIIPVIIGDEAATIALANHLETKGLLATAIRPPTVPNKSSRIRITLSASHSDKDIEKLIKALKHFKYG